MAKFIHRNNACFPYRTISKKTVIASFDEGSITRTWLESLDDDQWSVDSFAPETRQVCATVVTDRGTETHIVLILPVYSASSGN